MKIEIEILDDQLALIDKIRTLPSVIEEHLGKFPQSFPDGSGELEQIRYICDLLEFKGKQWIFATLATNVDLAKHFNDVVLSKDESKTKFNPYYERFD